MVGSKLIRRAMPLVALILTLGTLGAQPPGKRKIQLPCVAHSFERIQLRAGVPGYLKVLKVDIGDRVKRGDVLAAIDATALELDCKLAQVNVQRAQGDLQHATAQIAAAEAAVQGSRSLVVQRKSELDGASAWAAYRQKALDRAQQLFQKQALEGHLVDEAKGLLDKARGAAATAGGALASAKAEVAVQESKVVQARAARTVAQAKLEEARLTLEKAQVIVDRASIRAPFDGVITQRNYFEQDYIRSPDTADQPPVLIIERTDKMRVLLKMPDRYVPYVDRGHDVTVTFDALPGVTVKGKLSRLADSEDPSTRTMQVEIDVPNSDGRLHSGMYGIATLELPR